jgi:membrane protein required for colicin V production
MNTVDAIVLSVIAISTAIAFLRGFVREVLTIGSWIGAGLAVLYGFSYLKPTFEHYIKLKLAADLGCGFTLFIVTLILLSILSHTLARFVRGSALTAVDRSLGLLFGLLRGAILVSLAYMLIGSLDPNIVRGARTQPMMARGAAILRSMTPKEFSDGLPQALPISAPADETPAGDAKPDKTEAEQGPAYNKRQNEAMQRMIESQLNK